MREVAQLVVDRLEACLEIADASEQPAAVRAALGGLLEPAAQQLQVAGDPGDVLKRTVVQVEGDPDEPSLAGLRERRLAVAAALEQRAAFDDRAEGRGGPYL